VVWRPATRSDHPPLFNKNHVPTGRTFVWSFLFPKKWHNVSVQDPIVQVGDEVLRQKAKHIFKKDVGSRKLNALLTRMKKALDAEEFGVAIAAPQVGEPIRLFVVAGRVFVEQKEGRVGDPVVDRVYINPEIIRVSRKKSLMAEGCLSVRGQYGKVLRNEKITLKAWNEKGEIITHNGTGLLAQIFQHECDHLDGILYIDKADTLEDKGIEEKTDEQ